MGSSREVGLDTVSLALAVGRDYMRSAGEEDVMSKSVSRGTSLLCRGQDSFSRRSLMLSKHSLGFWSHISTPCIGNGIREQDWGTPARLGELRPPLLCF